jgi:hypothetical protein
MMNVPPSEVAALSLWEYEAMLHHWNEAHSSDDSHDAPDPERTQRVLDKLNGDKRLTH